MRHVRIKTVNFIDDKNIEITFLGGDKQILNKDSENIDFIFAFKLLTSQFYFAKELDFKFEERFNN